MKKFSTYEEQLEILKNKGLIIDNDYIVYDYLKNEGYYNIINGYSYIFKVLTPDGKKYANNIKFNYKKGKLVLSFF